MNGASGDSVAPVTGDADSGPSGPTGARTARTSASAQAQDSVAGRRHRRVVTLSVQDTERVAQGLEPIEVAEDRRRRSIDALSDARSREGGVLGRDSSASDHANDARLLGDVPPHWGHGPAIA